MTSVKNELTITLFLSLLIILFSASAIYYLEYDAQPDKFSSITESIWWASVSLATVGYGDVYPVTIGGKIFAGIISLVGIGIVAIPTGVISASFVEQINKQKILKILNSKINERKNSYYWIRFFIFVSIMLSFKSWI